MRVILLASVEFTGFYRMNEEIEEKTFDTWRIYRKVIALNHILHQEIYADAARILSQAPQDFSLLDVGCGDASCLAPILAELPISRYLGIDLSTSGLALARENLKKLPCAAQLQEADMLQSLSAMDEQFDVIFSCFALHHLPLEQKASFFKAITPRLKKGGFFLLIDGVREEGQALSDFLKAYSHSIMTEWHGLEPEEKEIASSHVLEYDMPETLSTLLSLAEQAGLKGRQTGHYKQHQAIYFQTA